MKLYFENRFGVERPIAEIGTKEDVYKEIQSFLDQYKYKSYYTRSFLDERNDECIIVYDVGSHTEFFNLHFNSREEAEGFLRMA